ncbi:hypothetical protein [Enterobacter hormaechei]|uniref:hypothetical protein n=1 Tax=Enterobacter hormaechei TaxID=158836 RepID=UPI001456B803|nr:hypothetical protein [Enterobacter hormaechei]MBA7906395.1 hypothetical protein [Enterobacter hormaechei]MBK4303755.1 hypothetical protein [Enterobacter hormaechei]
MKTTLLSGAGRRAGLRAQRDRKATYLFFQMCHERLLIEQCKNVLFSKKNLLKQDMSERSHKN